jgi:hypothetical protein
LIASKDAAKISLILILILFSSLTAAPRVRSSVGRALILSPIEDSHPFSKLEDLLSDLTSVGYSVDVMNSSQVTVEFLESALRDYSVIIFRTESIEFEGEALSFLSGEIVSGETIVKYQQETSDKLVAYTSSKVFRVFPSFIEHFYAPNRLQGKLIYFFSAFSSSFSSSFMKAGAEVFIGYAGGNGWSLEWGIGDSATTALFDYLCRGYDVSTSVWKTKQLLNSRWGVSAPFNTISYVGDRTYKITSITSTSTITQTATTTSQTSTTTNATSSSTTTISTTTTATTSTVIPEFPISVASFILFVATAMLLLARRRHLTACNE